MTAFKRTLAFLLVLTIFLSLGEGLVFASEGPIGEEAPPVAEEPVSPEPPASEEPPAPEETEAPAEPEPEVTPEPTPEVTAEPEMTPEPEITPEPVETMEPEITPDPALPPEPETTPEVSPDPSASPEPSDEPEAASLKQWAWTEPGNTVAAIMDGGRNLINGGNYYYTENGCLWLNGSKFADVYAENMNLAGGWLYYTTDNTVYRMSPSGGGTETVYTAPGRITEMYVMGQELRMLIDGGVWSYDMTDGLLEDVPDPGNVMFLIPTAWGNVFLTGPLFSYSLWAGESMLLSGVDFAYPDGSWLVVEYNGGTYQTDTAALFAGSIGLQDYSLHQEQAAAASAMTDEQMLASEAAFLESDEYLAKQVILTPVEDGVMPASTSTVFTKQLTANQQNIVLRAQQHSEVKWTPKADRYAWGGNDSSYVTSKGSYEPVYSQDGGVFKAGKTYKGIPYSQAVSTGYVGFEISVKGFLDAVNNANSNFYKSYSTYSRTAPYYGSDCSGFVSYAWDLPYRCVTGGLLNFSTYIGTPSSSELNKLQVGDCLNYTAEHVVLVTDIGYNSAGQVTAVEITEQTPAKMRVTCYGDTISGKTYDFKGQLSYITSYYLQHGYKIYRRNDKGLSAVRKPNDDAGLGWAPAPTMTVAANGPAKATVTLKHSSSNAVIYYTTNGSAPSTSSTKYTGPFTVSNTANIRAMAQVPGYDNSFPLNETLTMAVMPQLKVVGAKDGSGVFLSNGFYYADPASKLTLTNTDGATVYYTTDGSTPTMSSSRVSSSTSIAVKDGMVIKAFAAASGGVPSNVASFTVKEGKLYTITVDDPYGFVSPQGNASILQGSTVTFNFGNTSGYTLGNIKIDGASKGNIKSWTFENVSGNHTIKAEVKLPFNDVSASSWYVDAVAYVNNKGLFNGVSSSSFAPNQAMNRAMFITVLGRFANTGDTIKNWQGKMGLTNGSDIIVRSDTTTSSRQVTMLVASGQYIKVTGTVSSANSKDKGVWYQIQYNGYNGYVRSTMPSNGKTLMYVCNFGDLGGSGVSYCNGYAQWAYLNGIVNGVSSTQFGAASAVSRQDICVMIYNYLTKYRGKSLSAGNLNFKDSSKVSSYARTAVAAMANIGVVKGDTNGNFNPTNSATRAEVASIFMNLDKYLNG